MSKPRSRSHNAGFLFGNQLVTRREADFHIDEFPLVAVMSGYHVGQTSMRGRALVSVRNVLHSTTRGGMPVA